MQSEIVQILSGTGYHLMVMAAGIFAIVGSLLAASGKTYYRMRLLIFSLLLYTASTMAGYVFEGFLVSALNAGVSDPFDPKLVGSGVTQLLLFLAGSCLLIWFYVANMPEYQKQSDKSEIGKIGNEDN